MRWLLFHPQRPVADVNAASVSDMDTLRAQFTGLVTSLQGIASKLSIPSRTLSQLHQELNSAMVAISSIANAPMQFAEQLAKTVASVAKAVRSEYQSGNEAVNNSRQAQASMLALIAPETPCAHFNVQLVVATVLMSKDVAALAPQDRFDVVQSNTQPMFILNDLHRITSEMEARIGDATHVSTIESLELFNALVVLKDGINAQVSKVVKGSTPTRYATVPRCIPALTLAHQHNLNATVVVALNPAQHPLFLRDVIALEVMP